MLGVIAALIGASRLTIAINHAEILPGVGAPSGMSNIAKSRHREKTRAR